MSAGERRAVAWTFDALELSKELSAFEGVLSPEERVRADRFARPEIRFVYVVGRGVLRRLLAEEMHCVPEEVPIEYGRNGKPMIPREGAPSFNLSNSGTRIAVALAHGTEVGVDLERVRGGDWLDVAARYFTRREAEWLRTRPPPQVDRAFFEIWTRKEAYTKAVGEGLSIPLDSFCVPIGAIEEEGAALVDVPDRWRMFPLALGEGLVGACVAGDGARLVHVSGRPETGSGRPASITAASLTRVTASQSR